MIMSTQENPTTILIADDQGVFRAALRALFARYPYLKVVGEAAKGDEALRLAQVLVPDLVLLEINIRELDGLAVTEALGRALPATRVLILTAATDVEMLRRALRAGACGYVVKSARESELISAIEAVLRGDLYVDPSVTRALLTAETVVKPPSKAPDASMSLTSRQMDVLRLLCDGCTNAEVAQALSISPRTVESRRAHLMQKLGARNRAEMVQMAHDRHLFRTPPAV
jgi:two-component system response regulator NreC